MTRPGSDKPTLPSLASIGACVLLVAATALVAVILWRWSTGMLDRPMSAAALIVAALAIAATALIVRWLGNLSTAERNALRAGYLVRELWISVVAILPVIVFTSKISSIPPVVAIWVIVLLGEVSAWKQTLYALFRQLRAKPADVQAVRPTDLPDAKLAGDNSAESAIGGLEDRFTGIDADIDTDVELDEECDLSLAADEIQRIIRKKLPDGDEVIYGTVRVTIDAGKRLETAHLTFTPPLAQPPVAWDAEPTSGPDATISFSRVEMIGARLEIKLDQPAEASSDLLFIFSVSTAAEGV